MAVHRAESFEGTWTANDRQILQVRGDRRGRKTFRKAVAKVGRELAIGPIASTDDRSQHGILVCPPLGMKTNLQASGLPLSVVAAHAVHTSRLSMRRTRSRTGEHSGAERRRDCGPAGQIGHSSSRPHPRSAGTIPLRRNKFRRAGKGTRAGEGVSLGTPDASSDHAERI